MDEARSLSLWSSSSFTLKFLSYYMPFYVLMACFFLVLYTIPLYEHILMGLSQSLLHGHLLSDTSMNTTIRNILCTGDVVAVC